MGWINNKHDGIESVYDDNKADGVTPAVDGGYRTEVDAAGIGPNEPRPDGGSQTSGLPGPGWGPVPKVPAG